jgi:hypothetical protein
MKRLLFFLLFATTALARPHDYTLHPPIVPRYHAIKITPLAFAQTILSVQPTCLARFRSP